MSIGIYGGTFDPIHKAHIMLAEYALKELSLDKVYIMPAYIPPHKKNQTITDENHRLNMAKLAVEGHEGLYVSDFEIQQKEASYTANTLTKLYTEDCKLVFIVGADSFIALDTWYKPDVIFKKAEVACAGREGTTSKELESKKRYYEEKYNATCHLLSMPEMDISSHDIRKKIKNGLDVTDKLSKKVYDYIISNKLYI